METLRTIFIHQEENRLRSGWRILAHLILLFILSGLIALPLLSLANTTPVFAFLGDEFMIAMFGITLSVWLARRWFDKRSFRGLGLNWDSDASHDLLVGILIPALLMGLVFLVQLALGWIRFSGFSWQLSAGQGLAIGYWAAVFLMVGFYEELLTRGYWLQNMAEGLGMSSAVFLSSAIFGILHFSNPNASWISTLGILAAGYFLAYAYLRTRQLWLAIGLHIGWNFFQGPVFGFPVSGLETPSLIIHEASGPDLLTGGAFGPEAGLILIPTLALGAALVNIYTRSRSALSQNDPSKAGQD